MPVPPILVIDDNDFIRASMIKFLEGNQYKVFGAASAAEAMELLREHQFGVIITDILMPDTDGFELVDFIRGEDEPLKSTPIIAISGGGRSIDADTLLSSLEEKVDLILKKPFSKKDLLEKTATLLNKQSATSEEKKSVIFE